MTTFTRLSDNVRNSQDSTERHVFSELKFKKKVPIVTVKGNGTEDMEFALLTVGHNIMHFKRDTNTEVVLIGGGDDTNAKLAILLGPRDKVHEAKEGENWYQDPMDPEERHGFTPDGVRSKSKKTYQNTAEKGQGFRTYGSYDIKAQQNTQFEAEKHIRVGDHHVDGSTYTSGIEHAADHIAGGGTSVSPAGQARAGNDEDHPDGSRPWSAQGRAGTTSLLHTAAKVGTMGGMMGGLSGLMRMFQGMMGGGGGGGNQQQQQELEQRIRELEAQLQALQALEEQG